MISTTRKLKAAAKLLGVGLSDEILRACRKVNQRARSKAWYMANLAKVSEESHARYAANGEKIRARSSAWYAANHEKAIATSRKWHRAHPEKSRAIVRKYHAAHPEISRAYLRKYRAAHPEIFCAYSRNRRAALAAAPGSHTAADVSRILKLQKGKCYWCRKRLGKNYHVDHIVPVALVGKDPRATNGPENICIACAACNQKKNAKHPLQFARERGLLL